MATHGVVAAHFRRCGGRCERVSVSSAGRLLVFLSFWLLDRRYIIVNKGLTLMGLNNYMGAQLLALSPHSHRCLCF